MYNQKIIDQISAKLIHRNESVAVAESVTSGHLQAALSLGENARQFFQGGVTTYNIGQKTRLLDVEPIHASSCNCVSGQVADEMARHIAELFISAWGIAITGYATPVPECDINSLFAHYAIYYRGKLLLANKITSQLKNVSEVQIDYVNKILVDFLSVIPE